MDSSAVVGSDSIISRWTNLVRQLGFRDFVSPEDVFRTNAGVVWENAKTVGVYCFLTENGEAYVGQTVHARRRLMDHLKSHRDMIAACFMTVDHEQLDEVEVKLIRGVGRAFPTRNIKFAIQTSAHVSFDDIVSDRGDAAFIATTQANKFQTWRDLRILEKKQERKFQRLQSNEHYTDVLRLLHIFIKNCIPMPDRTEN